MAENAVVTESTPLVIHVIHRSDDHERTGTVFSSIFTLVSTMVGGGILSLPFAFQQGGFILTSVILLCVLMASTHGAFLIINSKRYCQGKIKNVEDVANVAFGNKGKVCMTENYYRDLKQLTTTLMYQTSKMATRSWFFRSFVLWPVKFVQWELKQRQSVSLCETEAFHQARHQISDRLLFMTSGM